MQIGDKVSRPIFLDNGVWHQLGDKCLKHSPKRFGTIVGFDTKYDKDDLLIVQFDDKKEIFFHHGVDKEG